MKQIIQSQKKIFIKTISICAEAGDE